MWVVEPLQADAAAPPGGSGAYYVLLSSEALDGTTHSLGRPPKKNKAGEPMGEVASDLVVEGDTSLSKEHLRFLLSASEAPGQPLRMFVTGEPWPAVLQGLRGTRALTRAPSLPAPLPPQTCHASARP